MTSRVSNTDSSYGLFNDVNLKSLGKSFDLLEKITGHTSQDFSENSSSIFIGALTKAKGGLVLFLILLTIIYNMKFSQKWYAKTLFNNPQFAGRVILDGILAGLLGVVSIFTVFAMRNKDTLDPKHLKKYFIIFIILALFAIAQESSGLNRYLNEEEIDNGHGIYNHISTSPRTRAAQIMRNPKCIDRAKAILNNDYKKYKSIKLKDPSECSTIKEVNSGGNPFLRSVSTLAVAAVAVYILKLTITMFVSAYYGYSDDNNAIENINYVSTSSSSCRTMIFLFETLIVIGLINSIPPLVSPIIRKEKINKAAFITTGFTFILATCTHILFQYSGIYAD